MLPLKWDWVSLLRDVPVIQLRGRRKKEVVLGDGSLYTKSPENKVVTSSLGIEAILAQFLLHMGWEESCF